MTPMKTRAYLIISMITLLLFMLVQTAAAQDIVAGVKPGDQFTYSVTGSYSSDASIDQVPSDVINAEATAYFRITIVNVSNPTVGYNWLWHFTNGTEQTGDGYNNLEIPSDYVGPFQLMVSANLTTDNNIHPHFGPATYFNETVTWAYSNYTRETNRLHTEATEANNQTTPIRYRTVNTDTYFDKQTGLLVQFDEQTSYQNPTFTTEITWKLAGQSAWTSTSSGSYPPQPFFTLPVIVTLVVVVVIVVIGLGLFVSSKRKAAKRRQLLKKK